jgi:hypothetical protein
MAMEAPSKESICAAHARAFRETAQLALDFVRIVAGWDIPGIEKSEKKEKNREGSL